MYLLRLTELRNFIERLPPEHFDMETFGYPGDPCGCIAHQAVRLFAPDRVTRTALAAELLGLDYQVAKSLFYATDMTQRGAVEALDDLIASC